MSTINFGIDLGTTNSAIAKYENGKVIVLKNPVGLQDTLPSVIAFKKNRIVVGDKARELIKVAPEQVFSSFKRKMGTGETFSTENYTEEITPVKLSAMVLSELKNFDINETISEVVITIPASFDTIQSNATKKAGYEAGFKNVVLLQEPIAACLTYSNLNQLEIEQETKWLVYDFGGGTFDAAIVSIDDKDLKVIDHKGNNFLGGFDIDIALLQKVIVPVIEKETQETNLWDKINDAANQEYNKFGKYLLFIAEQLKKELSLKESAFLEVDYDELDIYFDYEVKRDDFDEVVKPFFDESFKLIEALLYDNDLTFDDFERVVLVGGTTYIPYIRKQLKEKTQLTIDTSVDPTTSVVIGASYFAASKPKVHDDIVVDADTDAVLSAAIKDSLKTSLAVDLSYASQSNDEEELIAFKTRAHCKGHYRVYRSDGGFDTGKVAFENSASTFVKLLKGTENKFTLSIFDPEGNEAYRNDNITIVYGVYAIDGQPLPNDICIELDADRETYLELIFKKNSILPLKKTLYKTLSKSIAKGSEDKVIVNIVEGKVGTFPGANLNIGYFEISGHDIEDDLIKGSDLEFEFTMSESRDLGVEVYISTLDQEISKVFEPTFQDNVDNRKVVREIMRGLEKVDREIKKEMEAENYEKLTYFTSLKSDLNDCLSFFSEGYQNQTIGDQKYQYLDLKRKLLLQVNEIDFTNDLEFEVSEYKNTRDYLRDSGEMTPRLEQEFNKITADEKSFLRSNDKFLIRSKRKKLEKLNSEIFFSKDESYYRIFLDLKFADEDIYNNYKKVKKLIAEGDRWIEKENFKALKQVCNQMYSYVKDAYKRDDNSSSSEIGIK